MIRRKPGLLGPFAFALILMGCSNIYEGMSGKSTDEALYEDAIKLMDKQDYTASLTKFSQLSSGFGSRTSVLEAWAGAYAGECGLNFINYTQQLSSASLTGSTFFKYLMNAWTGVAVNPDSCRSAEDKIKQIWLTSAPTASQQFFMSVLSLVKIGAVLRNKVDKDGVGNLGDGTADGSFDSCNDSTASTDLMASEIKEIVTGFSLFLQNLVGLGANLSGDMTGAVTQIQTACGLVTPNPCATTEVDNVTDPMVNSMRDLLQYQGIGVEEVCMIPTPPDMCCP